MTAAQSAHVSERRSEQLLTELLEAQGWDTRRPPSGDLLRQQEYKSHTSLLEIFRGRSKTGKGGDALPEALLVDRATLGPLAVIETKADRRALEQAVREATDDYGRACIEAGYFPLAIGLAGTSEDEFDLRVLKWTGTRWSPVTYDRNPINWIPNRVDLERISITPGLLELRPTVPPADVLAERADEINRLLRESRIKDEFRPAVVGAIMLGLWQSKGAIRKDPRYLLSDINQACEKAFWSAKKPDLAKSLRVDEANEILAVKARRIVTILERLNVTILTAEHDYLGQLYETFFRYTGGNTIGQYFTPRHIASLMADLCEVNRSDITLDPACGTGGFLIAAMNRILTTTKLSRSQVIQVIRDRLIGFESEPITAALCVANMILRGDGSTGVKRGDCFTDPAYPTGKASVVLMNPPFPHRKTDTPPEQFIDRALAGLQHRGRLAVIVPLSLLVKKEKEKWRSRVLAKNTLNGVIALPDELFQPYSSSNTAILLLTRGVPHNKRAVFFARIENDGYRLRKGVRVPRSGSQIPEILGAYQRSKTVPELCGLVEIAPKDEWAPGAYIPANPLSAAEVKEEVGALIRSKTALVVKHAPQFRAIARNLNAKTIAPRDFREYVGSKRKSPKTNGGTIGHNFEIYYGQKELETKEGLGFGETLVISSSGMENGCYGFFEFDWVISPPIVTVPRTGSIGEAYVQEWPCGVTSDCLILVPRDGIPIELLYIAASVIRRERWRFKYGRKITPSRIAAFPLPRNKDVSEFIRQQLDHSKRVEAVALRVE